MIGRWLRSCSPDDLARILKGVSDQGLSNDTFVAAVSQQVAGVAARDGAAGQGSLLFPSVVKR